MRRQERENWDERLDTAAQRTVREVVRSLPEETVSLAWRSSLNEQLLQTAQAQRKRDRMVWLMRPALGLALAGAMAMVVVLNTPVPTTSEQNAPGVEAALLAAHEEAARYADVTGTGLSPTEVAYGNSRPVSADFEWSEVDVDSL